MPWKSQDGKDLQATSCPNKQSWLFYQLWGNYIVACNLFSSNGTIKDALETKTKKVASLIALVFNANKVRNC